MKILLTDGDYKNTLAAARALSKNGNKIHVVGGKFCLTNLSRYASRGFSHKDFGKFGSELKDKMLNPFCQYLKENKFDLIIPVGGNSVKFISDNRDIISLYTEFVLPDYDKIELALDKKKSANLCHNLQINVPQEYRYESIDEVIKKKNLIEFPVVIKSSNELQKFETIYCNSYDKLISDLKKNEPIRILNNFDFPIIQQKINGYGQGYFGVFKNGRVISEFMHERVRENPPSGGSSSCARSIYLEDLKDEGKKIIKELQWSGPAMIEFKREVGSNKLYFMEINPKLWGSLDLAIASGVNIPQIIVDVFENSKLENQNINYKKGLKYSWTFKDEILHFLGKPSSFISILFDFINPAVKKNISILDLKPSVLLIAMSFKAVIKFLGNKTGILRFISLSRQIGVKNTAVRLITEKTGVPIKKYSKIDDNIYIGAQVSLNGIQKLKSWNISTLINLRSEYDYSKIANKNLNYKYFPVIEFQQVPIELLNIAVKEIEKNVALNQKVYIHCKEGVSRAPTVGAAYLIKKGISLDDAIKIIKSKRPFINILHNQMKVLKTFENENS